MKSIRTTAAIALALLTSTAFYQEGYHDIYKRETYEIVNLLCKNGTGHKTKLLNVPIKHDRVTDSLLYTLVLRGKIDKDDVQHMLHQIDTPIISQWNPQKITCARIAKKGRRLKYHRNTDGYSTPLFSMDFSIGIIYVRYLGRHLMHEEVLVYEKKNGQWVYQFSLFSLIS